MSGHTPGPWEIVPYGDGDSLVICEDERGDRRIAFMATPGCRDGGKRKRVWQKIKANARLITTAPDGLALAQAILADCTDTTPVEWIEMARGIVRKANGESA